MIFAINRDLIESCHSVAGSGLIIKKSVPYFFVNPYPANVENMVSS